MKNALLIGLGVCFFFALILAFGSFYIIQPGQRGVVITLGKVPAVFSGEGLGFKIPLVAEVVRVPVKQQTQELNAEAFSSDLQQIGVKIKVLYRIPEASVISIVQKYSGDPFDSLIAPRIQEAVKEATALRPAEKIVKERENVKLDTLTLSRQKVSSILIIEDVVIENIVLSKDLERAIEAKMVQEQEAAKAKFTQMQVQTEADTAVIRAEGEAKAIKIRGEAIRSNPSLIDLQIVEKWNGVSPLVVGSAGNTNILLPVKSKEQTK